MFVKNIELSDLEEMEDVAEIAVNRCRNRLMYLQNRVQKRREMLEKVRDKLTKLEHDTINEDLEKNLPILNIRRSELGKDITRIKSCQLNMDEKMQGLLFSLEGQGSRLLAMDKKLNEEKRRIVNMEQEIKTI